MSYDISEIFFFFFNPPIEKKGNEFSQDNGVGIGSPCGFSVFALFSLNTPFFLYFKANVGCSDGCRCEGCQNSFGTSSG